MLVLVVSVPVVLVPGPVMEPRWVGDTTPEAGGSGGTAGRGSFGGSGSCLGCPVISAGSNWLPQA